jgi:hypothetical protein
MATKYVITTIDAEGVETQLEGSKNKRQVAVDLALEVRKEQNVGVKVSTDKGNVVFERPAPKKIKMIPRYTRVVPLPEGVNVPDGKRVAYAYNRRGAVILHDADAPKDEAYSIMLTKGPEAGTELADRFPTTRAAGDAMRAVRVTEPANA